MAKKALKKLHERARALAEDLRRFTFFAGTDHGRRFDQLKLEALRLLDGKLVPELGSALELPLFVAILGGTNTGKSTVFNALAGLLLSETRVTAGATKHPVIYVHERWKGPLLEGKVFDRIACEVLKSPGQLTTPTGEPRIYLAFHDRKELEGTAYIDAPDFDSIEGVNRQVAEQVLTQADVCVFLTTPQKYKDRVLVEDLESIVRQKKKVIVLFNLTDDEVIFRTMAEDLKARTGTGVGFPGWLPTISSQNDPERVLRERVQELVGRFLETCPRQEIKRETLREGLKDLVARVRALVESYQAEAGQKRRILEAIDQQVQRTTLEYRGGFRLAFPELGEALRRKLAGLELASLLPGDRVGARGGLPGLLRRGFEVGGDQLGRIFVESLDPDRPPPDWKSFWAERDEQDLLQARQLAQLLRARVDNHLRADATTSVLSLALLHAFFTVESLERFEEDVESVFAELAAAEPDVGPALLERVPDPRQGEGPGTRGAAALANTVKGATGVGVAMATGGLGTWDLLFGPLGFVAGAYGICLATFGVLKRQRELFRGQRERRLRALLGRVLVDPLKSAVESVASEEDMATLEAHCEALEAEKI